MAVNEKRVEIEIDGHKGWISTVAGIEVAMNHRRTFLEPREGRLMVVIEFDQAVDSILGFPVYLPARLYGKDAFLGAVKEEGEKVLERMLLQERGNRAYTAQREEKQRNLDSIATSVKAAIGLE